MEKSAVPGALQFRGLRGNPVLRSMLSIATLQLRQRTAIALSAAAAVLRVNAQTSSIALLGPPPPAVG